MNIVQFIKYINQKNGWQIEPTYYSNIDLWRQWWRGYVPQFHDLKEMGLDKAYHTRQMASLRMPKKACEDWASLLLNDKTTISIQDAAGSELLLGKDGSQVSGLLQRLAFWDNANELVEMAFCTGTGAFVMSVDNLILKDGEVQITEDAVIHLDYLSAECILPITVRHKKVVECAFASEITLHGKNCIFLQTHRLVKINGVEQYHITNEYFASENENTDSAAYLPVPLPEGVAASFTTGSALPWFSIFRPALSKNISGGPGMGISVFSEAVDACKLVDLAFDNYNRDIFLGGKKVFYNQSLLQPVVGSDGQLSYHAPDQVRQSLFWQPDSADPDQDSWHEYNPDLRVEDNSRAVQDALNYFSFKVGLGAHHYQFDRGNVTTARQYTGERQDMVQNANKHQIQIERALIEITRAMLWAGKVLLGKPIDTEQPVTINFDDSYITDSETRREADRLDAQQGFIPKYRYNMEWRGMSKEEARAAVAEAAEEGQADGLTFE